MDIITRRHLLSFTVGVVVGLTGHVTTARGAQVVAEPAPTAKPAAEPRKDPYADAILTSGEPPLPVAGAFTFVVLPDTQNYAERFPASYTAQTEWIVAQREARRIAGVFHLGDITNRNTPEQWKNAQAAMRVLHAYVYYDDTRYDWAAHGTRQRWNPHAYGMAKASQGDVHDGEQLWRELVSKHRNVIMTFNGHVLDDGLGRVTTAAAGREISQQLVNFQMRPNGGDGWLRLVEMRPDGTAHTWDYSPVLGSRNESPKNQFAFTVAKVG